MRNLLRATLLTLCGLAAAAAWAGEVLPPKHFVSAPAGSPFVPQVARIPPPQSMPVPTFRYGYFGARSRPFGVAHQQFTGELRQTIFPGSR